MNSSTPEAMRQWLPMSLWAAALGLSMALGACSHGLPNTAVSTQVAAAEPGILQQETPLAAIVRTRGIKSIDPASREGLLPQIARELAKTDPQKRYRGITYDLSTGNALPGNWIVQTPKIWDQKATVKDFDRTLPQQLRELIASAKRSIDIAALQPAPDGAFLDAMREGIAALARSGQPIEIRVLIGTYPLGAPVDARALLEKLVRDARNEPRSRLSLHVAAMRSCLGGEACNSFTWNHAKFIAVDGQSIFAGGHNFWARDYLEKEPVHDLSLFLRGPAAADATGFANALWGFVCQRKGSDGPGAAQSFSWRGGEAIGSDCLANMKPEKAKPAGTVRVLSVARLGAGITDDFANQNDLARDLLLSAATKSIYIAQQDLGFTLGRTDPLWPESTLERLADFLLADKGDVFIVTSNPNAKSSAGESYSNGVAPEAVARKIREVARTRTNAPEEARINAVLCRRLHVAPFRFGPDASWPENRAIANHAKFYMVDERAFYVGSDNFYPVNLQEFGYQIEDRQAATRLKREYWEPLWRWSRAAAVTGSDAPSCLFQTQTTRL